MRLNDAYVRTLEEDVRNLAGRTCGVTHDIDYTLREAGLLCDFGQHQACGDRRKLGGSYDYGIAGGHCGDDGTPRQTFAPFQGVKLADDTQGSTDTDE